MENIKELTLAMVGEDLMIYDLSSASIYILNKTAAAIYQQISEGKRVPEIASLLGDNYNSNETDKLQGEIERTKSTLEELGLLSDKARIKEGSFLIGSLASFLETSESFPEPKIVVYSEEELKNRYADVFATSVVFGDLWTSIAGKVRV